MQGLDQETPREWPWYVVIPFCFIVAPLIIGAVALFAGGLLALVLHALGY